eukprot:GHUV01054333.1.p1 GENE.GHUV01054333.1~~GHUV01054333.1.p1  ORF type:complete len:263 (-),score=78.43 GHUV01054333.1:184-879(-)
MTVWLLAPAAVSIYLALAVRTAAGSSTGSSGAAEAVSSPLVPILLIFHLLWSAAGLKLWRRQEAGLNHKWYHSAVSRFSSSSDGSSRCSRPDNPPAQFVNNPAANRSAAAAAPAGPTDLASASAAAAGSPSAVAAAAATNVIGRLPGDDPTLQAAAAGATGTAAVFSDRWGAGVPVASLVTPAAAGVRREYTGTSGIDDGCVSPAPHAFSITVKSRYSWHTISNPYDRTRQ